MSLMDEGPKRLVPIKLGKAGLLCLIHTAKHCRCGLTGNAIWVTVTSSQRHKDVQFSNIIHVDDLSIEDREMVVFIVEDDIRKEDQSMWFVQM